MPLFKRGGRMRSAVVRGAVLATTALTLAGCADAGAGTSAQTGSADNGYVEGDGSATTFQPGEREPAPEVSGETLEGEPVSLDDYKGQVLVINFWASWCPPCRAETPALEEVYAENKDDGLAFLGVNIKDDKTAAKAMVRNYDISYPSLYDQPGRVSQAFRETVPPKAIPSTLVIDQEGRIAARVIGATNYSDLTDLVRPLLKAGGDTSEDANPK